MKRILFFVAIASVSIACENKQKDSIEPTTEPGLGTVIKYADCACGDQNYGEVAGRLATDGQIICDLCMYTGIESYHDISETEFTYMTQKFWGVGTIPLFQTGSWTNISSEIGNYCYDKHLKFTYNLQPNVSEIHYAMDIFNSAPNIGECYYSAPLMKGIAIRHNLCDENATTISFTKGIGTYNGGNRVVILIKVTDANNNTFYYNITQDPKKKLMELI